MTGVEFTNELGETNKLMADLVVLAAFTVQNPRLLLASATDKHPSGLANSSGIVGKFVMSHPAALVYGLFEPVGHRRRMPTGSIPVRRESHSCIIWRITFQQGFEFTDCFYCVTGRRYSE